MHAFGDEWRMPLPPAFTRDVIPANRAHIPTPDMARRCSLLTSLTAFLPPLKPCEISLLIGCNCPQALTPREVITSAGNVPYGIKTDLGWCIVGETETESADTYPLDAIGTSHMTVALEVMHCVDSATYADSTDKMAVILRTHVREVIDPRSVSWMMERDFSEQTTRKSDYDSLSMEDR